MNTLSDIVYSFSEELRKAYFTDTLIQMTIKDGYSRGYNREKILEFLCENLIRIYVEDRNKKVHDSLMKMLL